MPACTFFGHRDCPACIRPQLRAVLVEWIEQCGVDRFYVGRQGAFDAMARAVLQELTQVYPHIEYAVVLERMPGRAGQGGPVPADTLFPEGLERVPARFAIPWRNTWMLSRSDYVVTYVTHSWGGAARFAAQAIRQQKRVVNLAPGREGSAVPSPAPRR